jgi:hypothetical protein
LLGLRLEELIPYQADSATTPGIVTRKFPTTILEINFCKLVVTNYWPAVLFAKTPVFTFDGIETGRKTTLASFHRVHLAKHRKLDAETGRRVLA